MLHERANGLREEDYGYMTMGGIFQSLSETKDFDKAINVLSDRDNWLANPVRMSEPLHILENLHKLIGSPLFFSGQIDHRGAARKDVLESLLPNANQYPEARFWLRWYQGLVRGDKLEVRILQDIALIPAEDWERGPEHIAGLIEEIEFKHRTSAMQRLVRDDKVGLFRIVDEPLPQPEVAEFVCRSVELALETALKSISPNVFNERSYEAIMVRDTLVSEPKSISLLAVGFYAAGLALQKHNGTLYPKEVALTNLMNALGAATEELCELDDSAKARCARLAGYNPKKSVDDLPEEDLLQIPEIVGDEVDDQARKIIETDVERALSKENPPTRVNRIRLTNWLTTISMWMDRAMKGDKRAKWLSDVVKRLRDWWPVD